MNEILIPIIISFCIHIMNTTLGLLIFYNSHHPRLSTVYTPAYIKLGYYEVERPWKGEGTLGSNIQSNHLEALL